MIDRTVHIMYSELELRANKFRMNTNVISIGKTYTMHSITINIPHTLEQSIVCMIGTKQECVYQLLRPTPVEMHK